MNQAFKDFLTAMMAGNFVL